MPVWVWMTLVVLLGMWLRVRFIDRPEAFVDEGANILSALDARVRTGFDPVGQGRPGLEWLFKPAGWLPQHALLISRLMSACAGLVTAISLGWTLQLLGGRLSAFYGMLFWAVMPLAVFHERFALQDPFITALLSMSVALFTTASLRSESSSGRLWFLAAGLLFGIAFLQKVSAALALPWLGIAYWLVRRRGGKPLLDHSLLLIALGTLVPLATLGSHLSDLGNKLNHYEATTFSNAVEFHPTFTERLEFWFSYYREFGRWSLLVMIAAVLGLTLQTRNWLALAFGGAWLVAALTTLALYNNIYARYILQDQICLSIFLALGMSQLRASRLHAIPLTLSLLPLLSWACTSWQIGTNPIRARISEREILQYYVGPWSGSGLKSIREYLLKYADTHQSTCVVFTYRFLRPGAYGLMLTELADPRIVVIPFVIYGPNELQAAQTNIKRITDEHRSAYFILYEGTLYPANPWLDLPDAPTRLVYTVARNQTDNFSLYQFIP